ncbi:MAG TPA: 50S ribosomal protein L35 [Solirubrobacterales bacterium]
MPKMKTHSGAKKRFKKTASGKLRGRRAYSSHILEKKSPKRKRRMARPVEIETQDARRVNRLLVKGGRK